CAAVRRPILPAFRLNHRGRWLLPWVSVRVDVVEAAGAAALLPIDLVAAPPLVCGGLVLHGVQVFLDAFQVAVDVAGAGVVGGDGEVGGAEALPFFGVAEPAFGVAALVLSLG